MLKSDERPSVRHVGDEGVTAVAVAVAQHDLIACRVPEEPDDQTVPSSFGEFVESHADEYPRARDRYSDLSASPSRLASNCVCHSR